MVSDKERKPYELNQTAARGLLDSLPFALALCDNRCKVLQANRAFCELVGTETVRNAQLYTLLPELLDECGTLRDKALIDQAAGLGSGATDVQLIQRDCSRVLRAEFTPLTFEGQSMVLVTLIDTTRQFELTRQLLALERSETLRQVCNTEIHAVSRLIEEVLKHAGLATLTGSLDALKRCSQVAREQLLRARRILDRIKALSTEFHLYSEPMPMIDALRQVERSLAPELTARAVTLRLEVADHALSVLPDERLIELSSHLLRNAIEVSPPGSSVRLEARSLLPVEALALIERERGPQMDRLRRSLKRLYDSNEPLSMLLVSDAGAGIAERDLERIFEPMVTTKNAGEAAGLGLTICRQIAQRAGGLIAVSSRPGEGSKFVVLLPGQPGRRLNGVGVSADVERMRRLLAGPRASNARLLVVGLGAAAAELYELLRDAGYRVRLAGSLENASEIYPEQNCDLALIDTDLIAARLDPDEAVFSRSPLSRPCLLLEGDNGFSKDRLKQRWAANVQTLVSQPWDIGRVFAAVRSALSN